MNPRFTKGTLETSVQRLNQAARALGLDRTFALRLGSSGGGVAHVLEDFHPGLAHPSETRIGATYGEAERFVDAMRHALELVRRDRDHRAETVRTHHAPVNSVGIYDPDSRSARRAGHTFG